MTDKSSDINAADPGFPNAPVGWSQNEASRVAATEGLEPDASRWGVIRALQEYYARHDDPSINTRELHDALEERFHAEGGMKYLYRMFPGGPVSQGCRIAGLEPPAGSADKGFGSVQ